MSAIKRTALDVLVSDCVREANGWDCEACGMNFEHDKSRLQCSHIFGRRIMRLRHDPMNVQALCASCHAWYELRPTEFARYVESAIGHSNVVELRRLSQIIHKRPKGWEKEARAHYRSELARIRSLRAEGYTAPVQFVGYW